MSRRTGTDGCPAPQDAGGDGRRGWAKRIGGNLLTAIGGLLIALLLAEAATRIIIPIPLHLTDTFLAVGDRALGGVLPGATGLRPDFDAGYQTRIYNVHIGINSKGLRDEEVPYAKPAGTTRVLSVGDSFAFGLGVELEEAYCKVAQSELGAGWQVVNTGVPGWCTANELDFLVSEGFRYEPDIATLCLYADNDVRENSLIDTYKVDAAGRAVRRAPFQGYMCYTTRVGQPDTPLVELMHRRRTSAKGDAAPGPSWIVRNSNLYRLARRAVSRVAHRDRVAAMAQWAEVHGARQRPLTASLLAEFTRQCAERDIPTLILLMPGPGDAEASAQDDFCETLQDLTGPAEKLGAVVIDLAPALHRAGVRNVYHEGDFHINAAGHRIVGHLLAQALRKTAGKREASP